MLPAQELAGTAGRARVLARNPLFARLSEADLEALAARAHERRMERGEVLFRQGDPGSFMCAILAGEVRIALPSSAGRDQVLRLLKQGDVFGEIALLDGQPRTADATALTNGRLLVLERRDLLVQMEHDSTLALRLIGILCERLRSTSAQLEAMLFRDTATRLAAILLSLAGNNPLRRIDMTQSALGELVGAARETVNRKLKDWEEAGTITLMPGRIILRNPEALTAMLPGGTERMGF